MENKENRIRARIVVEIDGYLDAPLLVGSGEDEKADMDQLLTADGIPFIPGSSMAGVLRSYLEQAAGLREAEALFGTLGWTQRTNGKCGEDGIVLELQSRILVYDTLLKNSYTVRRDGVRLNEGKTSDENMKFDMQAVETGADCRLRLEIIIRDSQATDHLEAAIDRDLARVKYCVSGLKRGSLRLGAKKNRGFGKLEVRRARYRTFRMDDRDDFQAWLDWNWDQKGAFEGSKKWSEEALLAESPAGERCMQIPLALSATLLIRSYASPGWGKESASEQDRDLTADCGQLALKDGTAVIPGSTWAGAVRSYVADLARQTGGFISWEEAQKALEPFWGTWSSGRKRSALRASRIVFEETRISGGHSLMMRRTAVDRFTGGAAKGALFGETLWAGGNVLLTVRWQEQGLDEQEKNALPGMLLWAVQGLNSGLLTVGGESGVGRGIFEPAGDVLLDGQEIEEEKEKQYLQAAALWCRRQKEVQDGKNSENHIHVQAL